MSSSGLSSPNLPEEKIHHEASTSKQKEDEITLDVKDDESGYEEIDAWANSILHDNRNFEGEQVPFVSIPEVSVGLPQGDCGAFAPNIISIGPYHFGDPKLRPMEKRKWQSVEAILKRNARYSLHDYIRAIKKLEMTSRSSYSGNIRLESKDFVEMLLFDGCFVVEYLLKECEKDDRRLDTRTWMDDAIRNDLLLLENQIPFFIILTIHDLVTDINTSNNPDGLTSLTRLFFERVSPINKRGLTCDNPPVHHSLVHHLLHLYHWFLFSSKNNDRDRPLSSNPEEPSEKLKWTIPSAMFNFVSLVHHLLHIYHRFLFSSKNNDGETLLSSDPGEPSEKLKWTIPSATFLEEAGIEFRKMMVVTDSVMGATFQNGVMKITPLFIDAFTVSQFKNLIAMEKFDPYIEPQVLAFCQFLDYIINTSKDVALLRKNGIIEHAFGSNEEVATIFNQLTSGTLEYQPPQLTRMYKAVDEYCNIKRHRWRVILMRDYFGSPWAAISLVAAVILLSLTFIQTFFSMYAYFKPPSAT